MSTPRDERGEERCVMPLYEYRCEANGRIVEVVHPLDAELGTWLEVCYAAQIPLGDTDPMAPVQRVLTRAPAVSVVKGPGELRDLGFTKLVKRDTGVYENVTATDGGTRYVTVGDDPPAGDRPPATPEAKEGR